MKHSNKSTSPRNTVKLNTLNEGQVSVNNGVNFSDQAKEKMKEKKLPDAKELAMDSFKDKK